MSWAKKVLIVLAVFLLVLLCGGLLPCLAPPSPEGLDISSVSGWARSASSLGAIGEGIIDYHKHHGALPPAAKSAKDGTQLYSWRVLILPYLEQKQPPRDRLYKNFKLDESWDSPSNKQFLTRLGSWFWIPIGGGHDPVGSTRYQIIVGPGTAFERPGLTLEDFPDGLENTILAVEASQPVPWTKPADLVYDPNGPLPLMECEFAKAVHFLCYKVGRRTGFNALFADGETRFIPSDTDEKLVRALITRNGRERLTRADLR